MFVCFQLCTLLHRYSLEKSKLTRPLYKYKQIQWILAGLSLIGAGGFFIGPTKEVTGLDNNIIITLCAFGVLGFAASPVYMLQYSLG